MFVVRRVSPLHPRSERALLGGELEVTGREVLDIQADGFTYGNCDPCTFPPSSVSGYEPAIDMFQHDG